MTAPRAFPDSELKVDGPNEQTIAFFEGTGCRRYAEVGVYKGFTALRIAAVLDGEGEVHVFDYEDRVTEVRDRIKASGYGNVVAHANSRRILDSYNWSLMRVLAEHGGPFYDYVFLDGAHTWAHDALAFFLLDRLLVPGGYLDFDDYAWSLGASPSMNPRAFPDVRSLYSDEQIQAQQVALIVDLLVRPGGRYEEIVPNKIFRKLAPA